MTEFLKKTFGDAVTEEVISQFKGELGKKFVAKGDYNTKRDELSGTRAELEEARAQAEQYRLKASDADRLAQEMESLQKKYDEHVSVLNGELEQMKLEGEINSLIRKRGGKNEKAVRALLSLGGENPIEQAGEQLDMLRKSDPYLFDLSTPGGTKGNFPRSVLAAPQSLTYSQMLKLNQTD